MAWTSTASRDSQLIRLLLIYYTTWRRPRDACTFNKSLMSDRPPPPRAPLRGHFSFAAKSARKTATVARPDLDTDNDHGLDASGSRGEDGRNVDGEEGVVAAGSTRFAIESAMPSSSAPPRKRVAAKTTAVKNNEDDDDDGEENAVVVPRVRFATQAARKSAPIVSDSLFTDEEDGETSGRPGNGNDNGELRVPSASATEVARKTVAGSGTARKPTFFYAKRAAMKSAAPSMDIASDDDDEQVAPVPRDQMAKTGARKTVSGSVNPQRATKSMVRRVVFDVPEDDGDSQPVRAQPGGAVAAPQQASQAAVKSTMLASKSARKTSGPHGHPTPSNNGARSEGRRAFGQPPNPPDAGVQRASKTNQLRPLFTYSVSALIPSEDALPSAARRRKMARENEWTIVVPSDERYHRKFVGADMVLARVGGGQDELTNPEMFNAVLANRKAARKLETRDALTEDESSSSDESPSDTSESELASQPRTSSSSSSEDANERFAADAGSAMRRSSSPNLPLQISPQTATAPPAPPEELMLALEPLILGPMRLRRECTLPFLLRNVRQGFEFKCKFRKVDTTTKEFPSRPVTVVYKLLARSGSGVVCEWKIGLHEWICQFCDIHGRFANPEMLEAHYRWDHAEVGVRWDVPQNVLSLTIPQDEQPRTRPSATSTTHLSLSSHGEPRQTPPLGQNDVPLPISAPSNPSIVRLSQAPMNTRRAMSLAPMPSLRVVKVEEQEGASETLSSVSTGSPETRATPTSITLTSPTATRATSTTLSSNARDTLSLSSHTESSAVTGTLSSFTLSSAEPEDEKKPKAEDLARSSRITTTSSHNRFSSTSTFSSLPSSQRSTPGAKAPHGGLRHALLGPAAKYPYLPEKIDGRAYYSCRPGGPRLYDLLNTLSLEPYGILSWSIIDREEELFEMDDIRDEDKVMAALWLRWVFLNRNLFISNYLKGVKDFVKLNYNMIYQAAGLRALRVWLLGLASNNYLTLKDIGVVLRYYDELLGQDLAANSITSRMT
ncbi:hypothetical protein CONPUDRAFT_168086 [Coniophora puteana RWD-64-598 SS2]|uniref:Uncharacterized protein n=1 Tax=Coniophora puteana (strain RWD-64-598) TaxID=741705 RepID=A0A5M3MD84_CONPW|nr:uncharacterized protein CONPUDRAFT_168086 [Coniophora puteana RWD-64-598 SS2]EIW77063.1 hypothetical protein CONPUDRAFT_168086 [Coniophora puteana RWD-64-598 SS2]